MESAVSAAGAIGGAATDRRLFALACHSEWVLGGVTFVGALRAELLRGANARRVMG
jgi:hypothetical protein